MRKFDSGATRDLEDEKFDYEGFLSPAFIQGFGEYMHKHRKQADGTMRDSDNWQKGFGTPEENQQVCMKSAFRHFIELWSSHRASTLDYDALYALVFNLQAIVHQNARKELK